MTDFEIFFAEVYGPMLDRVEGYDSGPVFSDGSSIAGASWDRKSAFLLFLLIQGKDAP